MDAMYDFRKLLVHLSGATDAMNREIFCTPCEGNYGALAYWVVVVNGSPPRGALVIGQEGYCGVDDVFYILQERSKRLGSAQCKIVRAFERQFLGTFVGESCSITKLVTVSFKYKES